ncbi:penicillin-binding transpeptidase domain-containing protein [Streptomyces sp. MUM 178J]|uniref:penicillin-binding transpeptidase domain-containing protein n=1 Tax=Streptomyces sp. MUM 178J TaxID=2791991 RepID=UPI001F035833|nr:penicillin-binding transpeptidase domain-containing protein [Streptomyces sp. MUM 178J]WRQ81303.1 penicillin-binding transpeptidase domain-containing protein [Streptomyces sp. MUM 178J]
MTPCIRRAAALLLLLFFALLANALRVQVIEADALDSNPANRRPAISRYAQPRGDILAGGKPVTGSKDTGEQLRFERTYADGPLYAPVTGYASQTYGASLLEEAEDALLSGADPALARLPFLGGGARPPGGNVVTGIRPSMQRAAFEGLDGRRGAVAALEPATGRVLALVSSPSYDPGMLSGTGKRVRDAWAELTADNAAPMLNRAIRQTYPPGSSFKIVTAAAALEAGVVADAEAPTRTPEPYTLPGTATTLPNEAAGCRNASLAYAVQWSCNTVMAELGVRVGLEGMLDAVAAFGFNDGSLRIPSLVTRSNFDADMTEDQLALSAIGQFDTKATPLQMAMVAAAVANGGEVMRPHLVDRVTQADGDLVPRAAQHARPSVHRTAMSPSTAQVMRRLMVAVVEEGTGHNAAIEGATVGGKTGTAQHGVGNAGTPYAWFIAWAQADDAARPAVAVAVVVEDASAYREGISGDRIAAPIARKVMEAALKG